MTTFLATLFLPIAAAVGCGIVISLLLQLNKSAMDLRVVELTLEPRGLAEHPAPAQLPSHQVTVLDVYGSLLFAGARTLEARLPDPGEAVEPVAVIRLRGRTSLGSTFVKVITDYAERLEEHGGRLYLSGLDSKFHEQLRRTGVLEGPVRTFDATPMIGESTRKAYEAAQAWLLRKRNP
jgi:SulP family sulfate permease